MELTLRISYHTQWGQRLFVSGEQDLLGNWDPKLAIPMNWKENGVWEITLDLEKLTENFEYKYFWIEESTQKVIWELGKNRTLDLGSIENLKNVPYTVEDQWNYPDTIEKALRRSSFSKAIFKFPQTTSIELPQPEINQGLRFSVSTPRIDPKSKLALTGNIPELGEWDVNKMIYLESEDGLNWSVSIPLKNLPSGIEYKYALVDVASARIHAWESGSNRLNKTGPIPKSGVFHFNDISFRYDSLWKGAGIAIPVFSLRSKKGLGVGEFNDLKALVDWAEVCGMKLIQLLPINDTTATKTWTDSYPYGAISVFALHPLFLNLDSVCNYYGKDLPEEYLPLKTKLNAASTVVYDKVIEAKLKFALEFFKENREIISKDNAFIKFVNEEKDWLTPYACFSYLRDKYETADFYQWGKYANYDTGPIHSLINPNSEDYPKIGLYFFLQYHLHLQLSEAVDYARSRGIALKGDIPIGIYRFSVDAWVNPDLYNMDAQSGAPPDFFLP